MLKTRVFSSVVGLILLAAVLVLGREALGIVVFGMSLIGIKEFYSAISNAGYRPVRIIGYMSCILVLIIGLQERFKVVENLFNIARSVNNVLFMVFAVILILFMLVVFKHGKYNINDIALTMLGVFYIPFLFSFIFLTRSLHNGQFYIWLIFIGAWATDTFAYFIGKWLGKTRFLTEISPNKTVAGAVGGVIGCTIITVVYGIILNRYITSVPLYHYVIIGVLCGVLSQIGDWSASAIKRYVDIKDYGNIMPGHGGLLDRFDSLLFVSPVIYFYISQIILK